ncbi:hypothetical protein [Anoxynatronum sibiricum]|uniref:Uncharacterized protein n=1 Tax=Anoxynatronum sibiricum TaxID=210623 RepID=A0ABU9VWT7_9CLOT
MEWGFEESMLLLVVLMAAGQWMSSKTRGMVSLQFTFGTACIALATAGILTPAVVQLSKLNEIGVMAFSVLMINTGASLSLREMNQKKRIMVSLAMLVMVSMMMSSVGRWFGWYTFEEQFAHIALYGNGAVAAIASNIMHRNASQIAYLPWLFFMAQSFLGIIAFKFSCGKVLSCDVQNESSCSPAPQAELKKIPLTYVFSLLFIGTLINKTVIVPWSPFHPSFTAIVVGLMLMKTRLLPKNPLDRTSSMEFLMMGLISLMALSLSSVEWSMMIEKLGIVLLLSINSMAALVLTAGLLSAKSKKTFYKNIMMLSSMYMGFPYLLMKYKKLAIQKNQPPMMAGEISDFCRFGYYVVPIVLVGLMSVLM